MCPKKLRTPVSVRVRCGVVTWLSLAGAATAQEVEHPEMFAVKEAFFREGLALRRHRADVLEKRFGAKNSLNFEPTSPQTSVRVNLRFHSAPGIEVRRLRFRFDDMSWRDCPVVEGVTKWHTFFLTKVSEGQRNFEVAVEGFWRKLVDPIFLGKDFVVRETFVPVYIDAKNRDLRMDVDFQKIGIFDPDFAVAAADLRTRP